MRTVAMGESESISGKLPSVNKNIIPSGDLRMHAKRVDGIGDDL